MGKNIILIGMPGAGKTTAGRLLSKKLGLKFVDLDDFIEKDNGKTIAELFSISESCFREAETKAIKKLSRENPLIIATGGGVVKNQENVDELKKNGIIIFIDRPIDDIASDVELSTRPLLKNGIEQLYNLYAERYELYKKYCDFRVFNDDTVEDTVNEIIKNIH